MSEFKTGGRVKGSRNKLSMVFVETLAKEFEEHGAEAIRIMRIENPTDFLKIIAAVIPKEFIGELPPIAIQTIQRTIVDPKVIEQESAKIDGSCLPPGEKTSAALAVTENSDR